MIKEVARCAGGSSKGLAMEWRVRWTERRRGRRIGRLGAECDCEYAHVWVCEVEDRGAETSKLMVGCQFSLCWLRRNCRSQVAFFGSSRIGARATKHKSHGMDCAPFMDGSGRRNSANSGTISTSNEQNYFTQISYEIFVCIGTQVKNRKALLSSLQHLNLSWYMTPRLWKGDQQHQDQLRGTGSYIRM